MVPCGIIQEDPTNKSRKASETFKALTYLNDLDGRLTSCRKMNPEIPATSSARNIKVKNMAYCGKHTHTHARAGYLRLHPSGRLSRRWSPTHQLEHPRAAAARGEAAKQAEDDDGGPSPDEDIWRVGAFLGRQREVGLQAHLPPHAHGQQDHACELKVARWET